MGITVYKEEKGEQYISFCLYFTRPDRYLANNLKHPLFPRCKAINMLIPIILANSGSDFSYLENDMHSMVWSLGVNEVFKIL